MMFSMRERLLTTASAIVASIAILGAGAATAAAPPATNGGATQVTSTSAVLNGTVDTTDPVAGDSAWVFEYGTTTNYGTTTPVKVIGPEDTAVSATITGLTPNTDVPLQARGCAERQLQPVVQPQRRRHVHDEPDERTAGDGRERAGRAAKSGRASLKSHRLKVKRGYISVPFKCSGSNGTKCKGAVVIAATGKLGNAKKKTMYGCAGGSFSTTAGRTSTLHLKVSKSCKTLLSHARHHQLGATLRATYSTGQPRLKTGVTLVG